MTRQAGPSHPCLRGRVDEAIKAGPLRIERHIRALEEWQAVILAHYPWPALVESVQADIDRLRMVSR